MKITTIQITGLAGGTVEGGWADELKPNDDVHTIVEVHTDEGLTGVGSIFTSRALVAGAVKLLSPFLIGERADEPMRVSAKDCGNRPSGRAAAARSNMPSAASTSPSGTCSARSATSRSLGCWAAVYRDKIKPYGSHPLR